MIHELNLARCLFSYGPSAENGFYILKWILKVKKDYFVSCDNYIIFKFQGP